MIPNKAYTYVNEFGGSRNAGVSIWTFYIELKPNAFEQLHKVIVTMYKDDIINISLQTLLSECLMTSEKFDV